ncbi:hypothetical protein Hanom_Chr16g01480751 [Helianthus anomalus]
MKSKLQVLSFMFVPNFRRCPLPFKLMSFVLNVSKSCTLCPLGQTQIIFLLKVVMCKTCKGTFVISPFQWYFVLNLKIKKYLSKTHSTLFFLSKTKSPAIKTQTSYYKELT